MMIRGISDQCHYARSNTGHDIRYAYSMFNKLTTYPRCVFIFEISLTAHNLNFATSSTTIIEHEILKDAHEDQGIDLGKIAYRELIVSDLGYIRRK